jgi:galactose mutarotase-like enzyme
MEKTFEEITIVSGTTQAKIAPERGGLLTSFYIDSTEIIYLDRETFIDATKNVRGGIPLLFPNAGPLKGGLYNLPQHGFVRKIPWTVIEQKRNSIALQLLSNQEIRINYPFDFELKLAIEVVGNKLIHSFIVKNTGNKPMPTAYGTHPYFNISQGDKHKLITNIEGFNPQEINWLEEFDHSFFNPGLINVQMPGKEIKIESDQDIFNLLEFGISPGKTLSVSNPGLAMFLLWITPIKVSGLDLVNL